jgi:hypothetical protein
MLKCGRVCRVLEVAGGTGRNLAHYSPNKVEVVRTFMFLDGMLCRMPRREVSTSLSFNAYSCNSVVRYTFLMLVRK